MRGARILTAAVALAVLVGVAIAIEKPPGSGKSCVTIYTKGITGRPDGIVTGPDGDLWLTEQLENKLVRFDPRTGAAQEMALPAAIAPRYPVFTRDGRLWFTGATGTLASYDPSSGAVRVYRAGIPSQGDPRTPVAPGNGFIYFTLESYDALAKLDIATGKVRLISTGSVPLTGLIADNNSRYLWAARQNTDQIVRFDTDTDRFDRTIQLPSMSGPEDLAIARDGTIYSSDQHVNKIGETNPRTGSTRLYAADELFPSYTPDIQPDSKVQNLTVSADQRFVWVSSFLHMYPFRLDRARHKVAQPACGVPLGGSSLGIVVGADGRIWYADPQGGRIVRVNRTT